MKVTHVPEFASPIHVLIGPPTVDCQTVTRIVLAREDKWDWHGLPPPKKLGKSNLVYMNPFAIVYPKEIPALIEKLEGWANETEDGGQLLLTTQSPYVVSRFEPEQVSYVRQVGNNLELYRLSDCQRVVLGLAGGEFYIGELWWNFLDEEWLGLKTHPPSQMCQIPLDQHSTSDPQCRKEKSNEQRRIP